MSILQWHQLTEYQLLQYHSMPQYWWLRRPGSVACQNTQSGPAGCLAICHPSLYRTPIDSQVHAYDFATGTWQELNACEDIAPPKLAHSAAAIGSRLIVFGGR